jgi:hypothetical protein
MEMQTNSIQFGSLTILIAPLGFLSTQSAMAFSCIPSCTFQDNADGTTTWKNNNIASSKADSAAVANSQNTVKCFAFCSGSSTASAGSAATSNANSPSQTKTITKTSTSSDTHDLVDRFPPPVDTMTSLRALPHINTALQCIDNTGSISDEGFGFGYFDAQHGKSIASIKDHGHHTDIWRTGYRDGFQAGLDNLAEGINKNTC